MRLNPRNAPIAAPIQVRQKALAMIAKGKSINEAAEAVGASHQSIRNWIKQGLDYQPKPAGRRLGSKNKSIK